MKDVLLAGSIRGEIPPLLSWVSPRGKGQLDLVNYCAPHHMISDQAVCVPGAIVLGSIMQARESRGKRGLSTSLFKMFDQKKISFSLGTKQVHREIVCFVYKRNCLFLI